MSKFQPTGYGSQPATPATSVWLVIDNLPGEDDKQRRKLKDLIPGLMKAVEAKVQESGLSHTTPARAGIAKTGKLRIFEEHT